MNERTVAAVDESYLNDEIEVIRFETDAIEIRNDDDLLQAGEIGKQIKQKEKQVKDFWKPMKEAAQKAHKEICSKEKAMLQPLENAERAVKKAIADYTFAQEKKRKELEEAARRNALLEAERKMQEAVIMEESGDAFAAEMAMAEAELYENSAAFVVAPGEITKPQGVSTKKDWEIVSIDESVVPISVAGICIRPVDEKAILRLIKSSKGQIQIEGVQYREKLQVAIRR